MTTQRRERESQSSYTIVRAGTIYVDHGAKPDDLMAATRLDFAGNEIVINGQPAVWQPVTGIWKYRWAVIRSCREFENAAAAAAWITAIKARPAPLGLTLTFFAGLERGFWSPNLDLVCLGTRATKAKPVTTGALTPYWMVAKVRGYDKPYGQHDEFLVYTAREKCSPTP